MDNYVQKGETLVLTAPYDRSAGQAAKVGNLVGVAAVDVLSGVAANFTISGVFSGMAKETGGSKAWTVGVPLYWDDTNKRFTVDSADGLLCGYAAAAAGDSDATGTVLLIPGIGIKTAS